MFVQYPLKNKKQTWHPLDELVGRLKTSSDLQSQQVKIRYNESTSVVGPAGRKIALRFPKIPGKFLSMSSLKLHFTRNTNETT